MTDYPAAMPLFAIQQLRCVIITHESGVDESDRFEMILLICDRLRSEFDLKG